MGNKQESRKNNLDNNSEDTNRGGGNFGIYNDGEGNQGSYNHGDENYGCGNYGDCNYGEENQGDYNKGDDNQGDGNQGDFNKGNGNQGDYNEGEGNQGNDNTGDYNIGEYNTGIMNLGVLNQGNGNIGIGNRGNNIIGLFCEQEHPFYLFDKPCSMSLEEFRKTDNCALLVLLEHSDKPLRQWEYFTDKGRQTVLTTENITPEILKRRYGIDVNRCEEQQEGN